MQDRDFKGVWIPKEIWLNEQLTMLEKVIFVEIDSLDNENHCTAGNEYLSKFCNCSESAVTKAIKHLQELEMIMVLEFDGRKRRIAVRDRVVNFTRQGSIIYKAGSENLRCSNISNNKVIKKPLLDKSNKGNMAETETFLDLYHSICTSLSKVRSLTAKREKAISNIIKKHSLEEIKTVFENVQASDFLTGNNDRGWKADIDFILREDKFVNILEGKYSEKQNIKSKPFTDSNINRDRHVSKEQFREEIVNGKSEKF